MQHRELGDSGIDVSEVGFGAWVIGTDWWGDRDESDALEMVEYALDAGINYFDTSDVYGHGRSEELLGEVLDERGDEMVVATKVGYDFYNNPQAGHGELPKEYDAEYLRDAVEKSLDRLGTDHVEYLQLHNPDVAEMNTEVLELLDELREEDVADAIGVALGPSIGWLAEGDFAIEQEFDGVQYVGNMLEQDVHRHFVETVDREGANTSLIPRVPHSSGLLNEQVTPDTELEAGDHRGFRPDEWYDTGFEKVETLRFLERDGERTMGQAAIQWLLSYDSVASVTPTFRSKADIDEWASAPETPALSDEERTKVEELYANDFGIDRFDGMEKEEYRTSVDGDDLRAAGILNAD
ncbi:aldo/keto reductase [Halosegnis rubeus]|uniref:Aldo/keto reductase n=1 Tax=Halosegnis rubeus TaxID=2212850 RepID=A0A5N5U7T7_9EURY|nr:aldo/keto reductase [Halosegnis rubeus]KAB7514558.1 aldo/keto reductase [Halosegnis rubeus]KAB7517891.1 aldo/keto reductase [Halosegnis rubeus]KAB7519529.1 aldo/keto reductase [Halosegnis rubeus]